MKYNHAATRANAHHAMPRTDTPHDRPERRFPTPDELEAIVQQSVERAIRSRSLEAEKGPDKDWLTNQEAMDYLGVSRSTLRRYRDDGRLPYAKIGQKIYFHRNDIRELLRRNHTAGTAGQPSLEETNT